MILVDTSAWIEFFRNSSHQINELLSTYIDHHQAIALGPVFGELLQGVKNQREEKIILEFWRNLPKVDESDLSIQAGRLSFRYNLLSSGVGLIDCYILAAGKFYGVDILSLDKKLMGAYNIVNE